MEIIDSECTLSSPLFSKMVQMRPLYTETVDFSGIQTQITIKKANMLTAT